MIFKGPTFKYIYCPDCNKKRSVRPIDYVPSDGTAKAILENGQEIEYKLDACDICLQRQIRSVYKKTTPEDIKKVLQALQNEEPLPEGKSIEELL